MRISWLAMGAVAAMALLAPGHRAASAAAADDQPVRLRYVQEPGLSRQSQRSIHIEIVVRTPQEARRTVSAITVEHQELVVEQRAVEPDTRVAIFETPSPERLVSLEVNGEDRTASVPEEAKSRAQPPALATQWRDTRGQTSSQDTKATNPMAGLDLLQADMTVLPPDPMKPGDVWTREVDHGVLKATLTTKYVAQRTVDAMPCAVLETTAAVTFTGDYVNRIQVGQLSLELAVALNQSGWVTQSVTTDLTEKADSAEQHITRTVQEKLMKVAQVAPAELAKTKADLGQLEKAMDLAKADDLDGAISLLETYLKDNPNGAWSAAIQNMGNTLLQRRLLTKPSPPPRLRSLLRDLQTARDRASAQGGPAQVAQVDQMLRQVATVNTKTILEESADPDPIVRDLAAFGLAFVQDPQSIARLNELAAKDASAQVRGTAGIALAIQGKSLDLAALVGLLKDPDTRVEGAGALVAGRTIKKDDPQAITVLPLLLANLKADNPWTRANTAAAVAGIAPFGSVAAADALVTACKTDKETRLTPVYLQSLKVITGVDAKEIDPYEEWLKKQPAIPPASVPAPAPSASTPAPKAAPLTATVAPPAPATAAPPKYSLPPTPKLSPPASPKAMPLPAAPKAMPAPAAPSLWAPPTPTAAPSAPTDTPKG